MPLAVYHFFQNGGRRAYIVRVLSAAAQAASATLTISGIPTALTINAAGGGEWGNKIKIKVTRSTSGRNPADPAPPADTDPKDLPKDLYDWTIQLKNADGKFEDVERFGALGAKENGDKYYASVLNRDSNYIRIKPDEKGNFPEGNNTSTGAEATVDLAGGTDAAPPAPGTPPPAPGTPPPPVTAPDYAASLKTLDRIDDASILVIPGAEKDVAAEGISYVHNRLLGDMIYVVDSQGSPRDGRSATTQRDDVVAWTKEITVKSSYAALYFPWVAIPDPYSSVSGATRFAPPSGMIAGLYARTDNTRGVWKAPAGTEAMLLGTVGLAAAMNDADQDVLNPIGINCIRQFPASGIVVWGSRTLATQSNPEYRYVPIRRTAMFLKTSLFRGTQWVVFEPNDEPLWSAIRFNINAFMLIQFRSGAFQGGKPADAFIVKCDGENNIQATIDAGQVHILVAFAPLKPAEFVIIHIQQVRKE
jgi:hypothetical protein